MNFIKLLSIAIETLWALSVVGAKEQQKLQPNHLRHLRRRQGDTDWTGSRTALLDTNTGDDPKHHGSERIHLALLSDRIVPSSMVISSVCSSTDIDRDRLVFHQITNNVKLIKEVTVTIDSCAGAHFDIMSVSDATEELVEQGFHPFWTIDKDQDTTEMQWKLSTPYREEKHASSMNLLRFYLPHLGVFENVKSLIFLDDDVLVQKDIVELLSFPRSEGTALFTGCQHWIWDEGTFETSYSVSVRDTGYSGNLQVFCTQDDDSNCVSSDMESNIKSMSLALDGANPHSKFAGRPLDRQAFNMGFNVIDTQTWINLGITQRFEKIVDFNMNERVFPPDTLAFGLVLGYFAIGDVFECYDDSIEHIVGLSFISQDNLDRAGFSVWEIQDNGFALHFNGAVKPWDKSFDHLCQPGGSINSAIDIWLQYCINAGICDCETTNEKGAVVIKTERRLRKGEKYIYKEDAQNGNEYILVSSNKGPSNGVKKYVFNEGEGEYVLVSSNSLFQRKRS